MATTSVIQNSAPAIARRREVSAPVVEHEPARRRLSVPLISFFLMVALPTVLCGVYYGAIASDVYVSEARFAIRGMPAGWSGGMMSLNASGGSTSSSGSSSGSSSDSKSGGSSSSSSSSGGSVGSMIASVMGGNDNQDAEIVAAYVKSRSLLDKIDAGGMIRSIFTHANIDPLSRLNPDASVEEFVRYWNKRVSLSVDHRSGVVQLQVQAFSPEEAQSIGKAALAESDALVNDMSRRRRADALATADDELARTEQRLQAARVAVQAFRNTSGQLDPKLQSDSQLKVLSELRADRISLENQIAATRGSLDPNSPTMQVLQSRLRATADQIAGLERTLTGDGKSKATYSGTLSQYEGLEVEKDLAQRLALVAQAGYERARITAERRQVYLVPYIDPTLPDRPTYPQRIGAIIVAFACGFALWSVAMIILAAVKDSFT